MPVPNWKGPPSDNINVGSGDPFGGGVSLVQQSTGVKLSPGAPNFEPSGPSSVVRKLSQLAILNRYSVPEEDSPVIVKSSAGTNGKAAQDPIGTRSSSFTPTQRVFFTTDVGPGVPFLGGHFIKVDRVLASEVHGGMGLLYQDVSHQYFHAISGPANQITVRLGQQARWPEGAKFQCCQEVSDSLLVLR